jgi:hypothetical protein
VGDVIFLTSWYLIDNSLKPEKVCYENPLVKEVQDILNKTYYRFQIDSVTLSSTRNKISLKYCTFPAYQAEESFVCGIEFFKGDCKGFVHELPVDDRGLMEITPQLWDRYISQEALLMRVTRHGTLRNLPLFILLFRSMDLPSYACCSSLASSPSIAS